MAEKCASNGFNINTLKSYFELKFTGVDKRFEANDKALELQARANDLHFVALNNENARILKATEVTVSRDTWDAFLAADNKWKADTEKALAVKSGQTQGIGMTFALFVQIVSSLASIALIIGILTRS